MLKMMFTNNKIEVLVENKEQYQGTYELLKSISVGGKDVYFVMGDDQLNNFDSWINAKKLMNEYSFIIFGRLNNKLNVNDNFYYINFSNKTSSTEFRNCLNPDITSKRIFKYIQKHQLYGEITMESEKTPYLTQSLSVKDIYHKLIEALINKVTSLPDNFQKVIIGVSGGLDSTLALMLTVNAYKYLNKDKKDIFGVFMPTVNTSTKSRKLARELMNKADISKIEINITKILNLHLKDINHQVKDVTYENAQARIRTLNLLNLANKFQGIVLGTGNLSEIALGFMTFGGDQLSHFAICGGIFKTISKLVLEYIHSIETCEVLKSILWQIINKDYSPELIKNQKTNHYLGDYLINDYIIWQVVKKQIPDYNLIEELKNVFSLTHEMAFQYLNRFQELFKKNAFKRSLLVRHQKPRLA